MHARLLPTMGPRMSEPVGRGPFADKFGCMMMGRSPIPIGIVFRATTTLTHLQAFSDIKTSCELNFPQPALLAPSLDLRSRWRQRNCVRWLVRMHSTSG
jgi:hypothetical protein